MTPRRSHLPMMAGWLFADLFLLLLITGLAAAPATRQVVPEPSTSAGGSPAVSGPASPTPKPATTRPPGLDRDYLSFTVDLSPDRFRAGADAEMLQKVNAALRRADTRGRKVGFVLVFASDDRDHVQRANDTALDVVRLLQARSPQFTGAAGLGYWNGPHDNFEFKVFLMN